MVRASVDDDDGGGGGGGAAVQELLLAAAAVLAAAWAFPRTPAPGVVGAGAVVDIVRVCRQELVVVPSEISEGLLPLPLLLAMLSPLLPSMLSAKTWLQYYRQQLSFCCFLPAITLDYCRSHSCCKASVICFTELSDMAVLLVRGFINLNQRLHSNYHGLSNLLLFVLERNGKF